MHRLFCQMAAGGSGGTAFYCYMTGDLWSAALSLSSTIALALMALEPSE